MEHPQVPGAADGVATAEAPLSPLPPATTLRGLTHESGAGSSNPNTAGFDEIACEWLEVRVV